MIKILYINEQCNIGPLVLTLNDDDMFENKIKNIKKMKKNKKSKRKEKKKKEKKKKKNLNFNVILMALLK